VPVPVPDPAQTDATAAYATFAKKVGSSR
jgi:hypothetical protein